MASDDAKGGGAVNRAILSLLSLGHLMVDISAGGLPALLPFLRTEFHVSYFGLAALVMLSGITSSIMQPIFGIASDALRTRFLLPLGIALALGGFAVVAPAHSYVLAALCVALAGIGSAMYHPEAAKSARTVCGALPATANSFFAVGGNIGVALGPLLVAGLIGWGGLRATVFLLVPALTVALAMAAAVPAVARAHEEHDARTSAMPRTPWPRAMNVLIAVTTLRSAVYSGVLTFVPLYAVAVMHAPPSHGAYLLFIFLAAGAVANLAAGPLADRFGTKQTTAASLALAPPALTAYLLTAGPASYVALALVGAFIIGTLSTTVVMGMEYLPHRVGLASALLIGLSTGLGGLLVGALGSLADALGLPAVLWMLVGLAVASFGLALGLPAAPPALARAAGDAPPAAFDLRAR